VDGALILSLAILAGVPVLWLGTRIWRDPVAGLCLWIVLLPVARTVTSLLGYPVGEGPEFLRKLTLGDPVLLLTIGAIVFSGSASSGALAGRQGRRVLVLFAGFCLTGLLSTFFAHAGPESLVEIATYASLGAALVVICSLASNAHRLRRILTAFWWAAAFASLMGAAGAVLLWRGGTENFLVRGGRVTGLFEAPNQGESFMIAVIPFLCATAFRRSAPLGTRLGNGVLAALAVVSVISCGSRAGVLIAALSVWLMLVLASPRAAAACTVVLVLSAGPAWRVVERYHEDLPFAVRRALSFVDADRYDLRDLSHGRANQLDAWRTVFVEHPVFGVGLDQFRDNVPRLVVSAKAQEMHSSYLAVLAETGLVGAVLMFTLLATVLVRSLAYLRRARRTGPAEETALAATLFVSYLALLLYGVANYGLRQRYFWFVVALIVSVPWLSSRARRAVRVRAAALPLAPPGAVGQAL